MISGELLRLFSDKGQKKSVKLVILHKYFN